MGGEMEETTGGRTGAETRLSILLLLTISNCLAANATNPRHCGPSAALCLGPLPTAETPPPHSCWS